MSESQGIVVENRAQLLDGRFAELQKFLGCHRTIKDALDWLMSQSPPRTVCDLVTLDEFSHDALAEYTPDLWISWSVS